MIPTGSGPERRRARSLASADFEAAATHHCAWRLNGAVLPQCRWRLQSLSRIAARPIFDECTASRKAIGGWPTAVRTRVATTIGNPVPLLARSIAAPPRRVVIGRRVRQTSTWAFAKKIPVLGILGHFPPAVRPVYESCVVDPVIIQQPSPHCAVADVQLEHSSQSLCGQLPGTPLGDRRVLLLTCRRIALTNLM